MIKTTKNYPLNEATLLLSQPLRTGQHISHHMTNNQKIRHDELDSESLEMGDILTKRYRGISLYAVVMSLLAIAIIWTAVLNAELVQQYHEDYMTLQKMKVEHRNLQIENQRLVIEQQTFSATPQIASRAVTQLGMYSPSTKDKLILQPMSDTLGDRLNIDEGSHRQTPKAQATEAEATEAQPVTGQGGENE